MAMNQPPVGGPVMERQQAQVLQQLRQMDHEQLVMLALQLINRLQELETQGGQPPMR